MFYIQQKYVILYIEKIKEDNVCLTLDPNGYHKVQLGEYKWKDRY